MIEKAEKCTMATQHADHFRKQASTPFSLVVDDVDARGGCQGGEGRAEEGQDGAGQTHEEAQTVLHQLLADSAALDCTRPRPFDQEQCDARIRQIKVEAESRKSEFARLLEEHAQVIRRLKQMEEDGAALSGVNA